MLNLDNFRQVSTCKCDALFKIFVIMCADSELLQNLDEN